MTGTSTDAEENTLVNFYWTFAILIVVALLFALYAGNRRPKP